MPIGNGRMGTLVWTTPSALRFQINRPDVFAENCETHSFPERHTDYGSGCGYVDIDFVDFGDDVFAEPAFRQNLSLYDAVMTVRGDGITARVLAWHERDVIAIEVDDQRKQPAAINTDLRMLRYMLQYFDGENYKLASQREVKVTNRDHSATSKLDIRNGRIILTQKFEEGKYYNSSAVAIAVVGRKAKAKYTSDSAVRLSAAPSNGRFVILISSAASFDPKQDVAALALADLDAAATKTFEALLNSNLSWWRDYWSKGFIQLHSADGIADFVEQHYTYFLYLMASTSRAAYPPRFGGMLWFTNGDMREWGAQHWWANTSCYYNAMPPTNRLEIMDPVFAMYTKMYDSCARAARQQWGSQGIFIPETVWFDGLEDMPDDVAAEMRDLYLVRKPWEERSAKFQSYADTKHPHNSRWNWKDKGNWENGHFIYTDKGAGPFGQVNHIFSSGAKIAYLYWLRYEYSQDQAWLRDRAYRILKGVTEMYRNFPNLKKEADGKYHIHNVNNHEPVLAAQDTNEELSAMHGIVPITIRAAEILGVDADMRPVWQEFLDNLAPLTSNDSPGAQNPRKTGEPHIWIGGLPPVRRGNLSTPGIVPALYYDLCTIATEDQEMAKVTNATYDAIYPHGISESTPVNVLNRNGTAAAHLGRASDLRHMLPNQLRCLAPEHDFCDWPGGGKTGVLPNRLELREGPGAIDAERIGRVSEALHEALLQSVPPAPGKEPIIYLFPAWPKEWDAQYTLLARGAFLVNSSIRQGKIEFVQLVSQAGGECRVRNPWQGEVALQRRDGESEALRGSLLKFNTQKGEKIILRSV